MNNIELLKHVSVTFGPPVLCGPAQFPSVYRMLAVTRLSKLFDGMLYRGADKSLARPGRKQITATEDFDFYVSYL